MHTDMTLNFVQI